MHRADELNAVLPSEEVSSEQIEDTMLILSNMDITVVESEDHEDGAAAPDGEDGADNDEAGGHAVAIATTVPAITQARTEPAERTDDAVRIYLRDMGSVKLFSRGGEIAIAKRIEAGREAMIVGLCEDYNAHPSLPHPSRGAGAGMNTDHTLEEVGRRFSVTRERIRQIEAKALGKLKHPSRSRQLRSFLDN